MTSRLTSAVGVKQKIEAEKLTKEKEREKELEKAIKEAEKHIREEEKRKRKEEAVIKYKEKQADSITQKFIKVFERAVLYRTVNKILKLLETLFITFLTGKKR